MKPNPRLRANIWSKYVHSWIYPLLKSSRKRTVNVDDLYELLPDFDAKVLTDKLEHHWLEETKRNSRNPSLLWATVRTLGWTPFLAGLLLIPQAITKILQAIWIILLMDFFESCTKTTVTSACLIAAATVTCSLCTSACYHPYYYTVQMYGLKMRIAYSGLIYRKVLRLSRSSLNSESSGKITNLVANDAEQIDMASHFFHYLWVAPLELCLASIVFWYFVKYISLVAIIYTVLLIFAQMGFGELFVHFRASILKRTDERLKVVSEMLRSMRVVKMYCWEIPFERKIKVLRRREIVQCAYRLILDCVQTLFSHTHLALTLLMTYIMMWILDIRFNTRLFAILVCIVGYMRMWTIDTCNYAVRNFVHYLAAQKRIKAFLLLDESECDVRLQSTESNSTEFSCSIECAQWKANERISLENINIEAKSQDLICIIGTVGSGKSSLLETLTGEIQKFNGHIQVQGSICYVPQEPWIFPSTIEENILFGKEYNPSLFQHILEITALTEDIHNLASGIKTYVGDQGVMLSGGQKARVSLARALYHDADVYLLDDPLSAVDVKVANHIFSQAIKGFLQKKICILATHQVQFLQNATHIIVLSQGNVIERGSYKDLVDKPRFRQIVENIKQHQCEESKPIDVLTENSGSSAMHEDDTDETKPMLQEDDRLEGMVKVRVYASFVHAGAGIIGGILIPLILMAQQGIGMFGSWWLASWSEDEGQRYGTKNCTNLLSSQTNPARTLSDTEWNRYRNRQLYIYCVITVLFAIMTWARVMGTEFMCLNAGRVLHNRMLRRILQSPIHYFDVTPVGRILNRFSRDISIIDDSLPLTLFDFLQTFCHVIGTMILIGWLNPWSFIPAGVALVLMIMVRSLLANCSRDLKRLESGTRTPIYSYLASSIQGATIIRSMKASKMCSDQFLSYLNANTSVNYILFTINRWAAFRFDWITAGFIVCVTYLAIVMRTIQNKLSPVDIALTLAYSLNLMGLLQWSLRLSVETECLMTAAERILEYRSLAIEPSISASSTSLLPQHWPSDGRIRMENISVCHSKEETSKPVLRKISLDIKSAEKIGIVGRTGAGKTTLVQALFRLSILTEGVIYIDNIDISRVTLNELRQKISVIPQNPVLFTDTLRTNLDPFGMYSDSEIWQALEEVQLKDFVKTLPNSLMFAVTENGSNLSSGQRQLVCLARAILKRNRILVIDEATANVDYETGRLVQQIIKRKFNGCTVLTIAHRLHTVLDNDRILVLNNGEVMEFDEPKTLLENSNSELASLVREFDTAGSIDGCD